MLDARCLMLDSKRFSLRCVRCRVDPGGYPPRPPTDPDVRNSRIRLFGHMVSLRGVRPSRTYWFSQLSCLMQFRRDGSEVQSPRHLSLHQVHAPAPPSLLRVPLGSVPRTHRYYETLRLPAIHPGELVDSPAGTVLALLVCSRRRPALPTTGLGFNHPAPLPVSSRTETTGSPEFPSDPLDACPAPSDPGGTGAPGLFGARDVAFR